MQRCIGLLVFIAILLAGCGSTTGDRAASGAGIGAGAGAVLGAVTGLGLVQGVLIGAGAGALTGGLTDTDTIDLGDPLWRSGGSDGAQDGGSVQGSATVRRIQWGLTDLGYDAGPADGVAGPRTKSAIYDYQLDQGLSADGRPSPALARHIEQRAAVPQT